MFQIFMATMSAQLERIEHRLDQLHPPIRNIELAKIKQVENQEKIYP